VHLDVADFQAVLGETLGGHGQRNEADRFAQRRCDLASVVRLLADELARIRIG
jgi:hypothetical protein